MNVSSFFDYPAEPTEEKSVEAADLLFLPNWSHRDWMKLFEHTETYRFGSGDIVIRQGEKARAFYLIAFGRFELLSTSRGSQKWQRVSLVEQGSILGEQSFLDGLPHPTQVQAITEGEVLRLSYEAFEILMAREPEVARDILFDLGRILSIRLRQVMAE